VDLRALAETTVDRRSLAALASGLDPATVGAGLTAALAARDDRAFTTLVLAALHRKLPIDALVLRRGAALLPDADALAIAVGHLDGDVAEALLAALDDRGLGYEREPTALLLAELWCRRKQVARPARLLAEARIRARRVLTQEGEDAMVALQGLLDDPDLATLLEGLLVADVKDAARAFAARVVERMVDAPLAHLPERARKATRGQGSVRRATEKVGRNDACWCGSGKKYKSCHEAPDRERNADASDVAGLTMAELSAELEQHLSVERMKTLRGHELARLDAARVPVELRTPWIELLGQWGEHAAALAAVRSWLPPADQGIDEALDECLRFVAEFAARSAEVEVVREALALRRGRTDLVLPEARLVAVPPEERFALLEDIAREQLDAKGVDLGFALLSIGYPALGVHVARSELVLRARDPEGDALYALMVEARDRLAAPPWDPIDDVLHLLDRGVDPEVEAELAASRQRMSEREAALQATQVALSRAREELAAAEQAHAVPAAAPSEVAPERALPGVVDEGQVRELRERLETLKKDLKERHRERNSLRKELEEARERVADLEAKDDEEEDEASAEEDEDDGPGLDAAVASRLRLPRWPDGFHARLKEVPEATARAALLRVGELCAGFDVAYREVRPLRGFADTWRVKVGRSYRLLFRPVDDTLEVIDLLHRQDLEKRLFRLRRGGE
jgi:regulator of replication initiation timing